MKKVLLDTDIGTDVDDAVCLAYLLAHPDCELLGITTVTGEPERRAALASAVCLAAGRDDIPIYPGAGDPLQVPQMQKQAQQAAALVRWPHQAEFPRDEATYFLSKTIRAHPGEVNLLSIGPLTNLGRLFSEDPEIPSMLNSLVMMAGLFTGRYPEKDHLEWNAMGDPHASDIVYNSPVQVHRSIGLDVTQQVSLSAEEVRERFTAPLLKPVLDFAEIWFQQWGGITFHDPLAAATIFENGICTFAPGKVTIEMAGRPGRTLFEPGDATSPHQVAVEVDPQRYFDHFFKIIGS